MKVENELEQPAIEFIATDVFGIVQTGKRNLSGLTATSYGPSVSTFQSGYTNVALFGQGLKTGPNGTLFIDVADDSLSFTGSSNNLTAFTMGAFYNYDVQTTFGWFVLRDHGTNISAYQVANTSLWRVAMLFWKADYIIWLAYTTPSDSWGYAGYSYLPTSLRTGWVHNVYSYDPAVAGGTVKYYLNGELVYNQTNLVLSVGGTLGGYEREFFS